MRGSRFSKNASFASSRRLPPKAVFLTDSRESVWRAAGKSGHERLLREKGPIPVRMKIYQYADVQSEKFLWR